MQRPLARPLARSLQHGAVSRFSPSVLPADFQTEAAVRVGAGVTSGVTPGVLDRATGLSAGVYATDYGINPGDGSTQTDRGGFTVFNVTSAVSFTGATGFTVTGTGTSVDPYLIQNYLIYAPATAASVFTWNHSAGTYHIKFKNCLFCPSNGTAVNMFQLTAMGTGSLTLEDCNIGGIGDTPVGNALIQITAGTLNISRCLFTRIAGMIIWKNGASATVTVTDCSINTLDSPWAAGIASANMFHNSVAGGSLTVRRTTVDHRSSAQFVNSARNWAVTLDRVNWNSSDDANVGPFINTNTTNLLESWTSGLTMTDCIVRSGTSSNALLGWSSNLSIMAVKNFSITHCEFLISGTRNAGKIMICLGDPAGASGDTDSNTFLWCRFTRPQSGAGHIAAGNEIMMMFRPSNFTCKYCWTNSCGEDAYEITQPYANCEIGYCGGGEISSSYVGGNMVDIYGAGTWTSSSNVSIHHIWGTCHSDAVIVDCCTGVTVQGSTVDVDNSAGGFVDNPPAANVRLHARLANDLNGVVCSGTPIGPAFDSRPVLLTLEPTAATTVLAALTSTTFTVNSATGFAGGQLIMIELDATSSGGTRLKHYTTIANLTVVTITLTDALPSAASATRVVQTVALFDAGTVTYPSGTGLTGVVDAEA